MSTQLANEVMQIVEDLDASQLKLEKNAFDVINSSDTSLNLVKEGITSINDIVDEINGLNTIVEESKDNIKRLEELSEMIEYTDV